MPYGAVSERWDNSSNTFLWSHQHDSKVGLVYSVSNNYLFNRTQAKETTSWCNSND